MTDKLLLTGFEPFGGESINPSWKLVESFDNKIIGNYQIVSKEIPTVFYECGMLLDSYIKEYEPKIIICFGQAGGSKGIRLERVAINLNDASIPDNDGNTPNDEPIIPDGPAAYFTGLPVKNLLEALKKENIPAFISYSAGTYVCNNLFYQLMNYIEGTDMTGGFIHIPYLDEQVQNKENMFSMTQEELVKALESIINTVIA